jgi:hypothetical protein
LPELAFGIAARGQVEVVRRMALGLELSAWPEKQSDEAGPGGGFTAWIVTALGCPTLVSPGRVEVQACAAISSGIVSANGLRLAQASSPSRFYASASLRGLASVSLVGPLSLAGELGLAASFTRPRYYYREQNGTEIDVHRSGLLVPLGGIFLRADL